MYCFNKIILLAIIMLLGAVIMSCKHSGNSREMSDYYGVWANKDTELVQTENYTLLFSRNDDEIEVYLSENRIENDTLYTCLVSGYVFNTQTTEYYKVEPGANTKKTYNDFAKITDGEMEISLNQRQIRLRKIENIIVCEPYEMPYADENSIGKCLQNWQLGVSYHSSDDLLNVQIGTNKHSYIFSESPAMLYLRGAKLTHNNNGSLFTQNIRLMINNQSGERTVFMKDDNVAFNSLNLVIDDSLFQPDACTFDKNGIYWSCISFEPSVIKLNGCGEEYAFTRVDMDDESIVEWFEYE